MKLLLCRDCEDVFKLHEQSISSCHCGSTQGAYIDNLNAVYKGNAIPLGFGNTTLVTAIKKELQDQKEERSKNLGHTFDAFVIPWNCNTFTKVDNINEYL